MSMKIAASWPSAMSRPGVKMNIERIFRSSDAQ